MCVTVGAGEGEGRHLPDRATPRAMRTCHAPRRDLMLRICDVELALGVALLLGQVQPVEPLRDAGRHGLKKSHGAKLFFEIDRQISAVAGRVGKRARGAVSAPAERGNGVPVRSFRYTHIRAPRFRFRNSPIRIFYIYIYITI